MAAPADLADVMRTVPLAPAEALVVLPVIIPIAVGGLLVMLRRRLEVAHLVAIFGLAALLAADIALLVRVLGQGPAVMAMGAWHPPFGIVFAADVLGTSLATLSAAVALLAAIYSAGGVTRAEWRYGYYPFLMLLMAGVTGSFLTGDIFNLYVWFEVLLISSIGLMVIGSEKRQIDGALKYGLLNLVATTLFLIATAYLYGTLGTLNMADIAARMRASPPAAAPLVTIAALYLVAFGMKAAAFPLNFWLPASYHTPSAGVSALFAGLLTKVGAYALIKTEVLLMAPAASAIAPATAWVAGATMLAGSLGALAQSDIRRLLGFLVISGIGNILIGVAIPHEAALTGAILYAFHSMLAMSALYLACGLIERQAGSGDLRAVGGLMGVAPRLSIAVFVLVLAGAGLPPFSGFWPKAMLVDAAFAARAPGLALMVLAAGLLNTIALSRVFLFAVWRAPPQSPASGEGTRTAAAPALAPDALAPVFVLAAAVVAIGLWPRPFAELAGAAARGILDPAGYIGAVLGGGP